MELKCYNFKTVVHTLLLWLVLANFVAAQKIISGIVLDKETSEAIIGANIILSNNENVGTITDIDGKFSLEIPSDTKSIEVSYTGYETQVIDISNSDKVEVSMVAGEILENVVVIGYGTVKREDLTGSIQAVSSEKFNKGAITGPQELLAGKVAGVTITTNDGSPGGGSTIRIRGLSSLTASNDPLIVVDGIPLDNTNISGSRNNLNIINPNDIESMTVLKDASAAAIYGNRGLAGVILITTKKGKVGSKLSINYSGNYSIGKKYNQIDMLNADEYRALINEKYYNPDKPSDAIKNLGTESVNWQDLIYQEAHGMDHTLGFSGSLKNLPYRVSLGYTDKDGLLKTDNFKRYSTGINITPGFLDNRLQVNLHLKAMLNKNHFADRGAIGNSLNYDPTRGPYDANDTKYGGYTTWTAINGNPNNIAPTNPIALLEQKDDNSTVKHYIANANINYRLKSFPNLLFNLTLGHDQSNGNGKILVPETAAFAFDASNGNGVNNLYEQEKKNNILETYANYKKSIGKHNLDVMAGYSWQHFKIHEFFNNNNTAGTKPLDSDPNDLELYLISLFSRINYNFNERVYVTLNMRRDGASRFAKENRWGWFPGASVAFKLIDNDNPYFNNIKLRAGVGTVGQQDIGLDYYSYLAKYTASNPFAKYQLGDQFLETLRPEEYDANVKWEENTTYNIATDVSIIKNKLSATLDLYQKNTFDLLNRVDVAAGTNLSNRVTTNIGNMETKGVELALTVSPIKGWDFAGNIAYNNSKITKLTATDDPSYPGIATGGISGGVGSNIQRHQVGYSPATFYTYKQKYDEQGNLLEGQYEDVNGDGVTNSSDFYYGKSPLPTYTIGFTNNVSISNFDFSFAGRANLGQYVYNNVMTDMGFKARAYASNGVHWGVHQSAVDLNVDNQSSLTYSDHFISDASFLRLDHVTLGYSFPKVFGGLRIYTTIQNPLVVTKYKGLDPELGNGRDNNFYGIDNNIYPRPRTYLGGLSITF